MPLRIVSLAKLRIWLLLMCVGLAPSLSRRAVAASEKQEKPKPTGHQERVIQGWTVRVDDRLLLPENGAIGSRALQLLEAQLADIASLVQKDRLAKLRTVTIVLDLTHGGLVPMQYHPSAGWLTEHGYSKDLARCVHIPDAADFVNPRHNHQQPWCVLHELAHSYHDQTLGFDDKQILAVYEKYRDSGHGKSVLHIDGSHHEHYALTNHKEFFAEMSESYFGMNDFFPFNQAELKEAEPEIFQLMKSVWGPTP
ncbi:MAG TPA: hypothetical protein VFE24_11425 [Pirellulales bacterium]|jgi:hypothetical protein|nr:hypothetical protein [Pirellulales bacterium]